MSVCRYRDSQRHSPQNHPRIFQWDAVDTSLDLGGKCPQNARNGYWTYKADDRNAVRGNFLSLDLFSFAFRNIFLAVLRRAIAPPPIAPLWTRHRDDHQCDVRTHLPRVACFARGLSTPRIKDTYLRKKS